MPLLHKKPFVRKSSPTGISPSDKVFYCELTNEAFSDYDEYWERLVLCNAMVWTCELTGRPNLTYQEAVESEAKGLKFLSGISTHLKLPLLYVASLTRRGRQSDLSDDVFNHCRDRYFPGEPVEAIIDNHWYDCKVIRVIYPTQQEIALYEREMADSDEELEQLNSDPLSLASGQDGTFNKPITLDDDDNSNADSDIQIIDEKKSVSHLKSIPLKKTLEKDKSDYPPYATYKYEVQEVVAWDNKTYKRVVVSWEQIRRSKVAFTREKCKLFFKISTELLPEGYWALKKNVYNKFNIGKLSYQKLFPGPAPKFTETKSRKLPLSLSPRGKELQEKQQRREMNETKQGDKKEERLIKGDSWDEQNCKKRGRPSLSPNQKLLRNLERMKCKQLQLPQCLKPAPKPAPVSREVAEQNSAEQQRLLRERQEHFARIKEILKQKSEKEKAQRKQERDVKKEQRRLLALEMKDWLRPKEDLMCGQLKPLPAPVAVECGVPNHMFGELLALLEFLNNFSDVLELNDVYPYGITFEMLESAIVTKEVAGVFNDVVQLLLGAVFSLQEEEDEEITADTTVDPSASLSLEGGDNDQRTAAVQLANRASQWSTQQHNTSLHQLPLDALTLTEVLRLHLLASGADNNTNAQWRHINRGGYKHWDDPGLQFKLNEPEIVKTLAAKSIFDMHIEDKLKLLCVLMHQILTYAGVRDRLEEAFDKIREVKQQLRDHQSSAKQIEREEHQARVLKKKEALLLKKKQPGAAGTGGAKEDVTEQQAATAEDDEEPESEEERREREEREEKIREKKKQEHSKKEMELLEQIMTLSAKTNPIPLGQDRAYRRYWIFNSVSGVFVEDDEQFPGACCGVATRDVVDECPEASSATLARLQLEAKKIVNPQQVKMVSGSEAVEEKANTSDKENDTSAMTTPTTNGVFNDSLLSGGKMSPNHVQEVITRVLASTPGSSPISSGPKKLLKANVVHNGPAKGIHKSAKDQSITKFFSKSPKCVKVDTSETVDRKYELVEEKLFPQSSIKSELLVESSLSASKTNSPLKQIQVKVETQPKYENSADNVKPDGDVTGLCTADLATCPVHNTANKLPKWYFFYKDEDINALIEGLNDRGEREHVLKENLIMFKATIENNVKNCPVYILNPSEDNEQETAVRKSKRTHGKKGGDSDTNLNFPIGTPIDHILELTLRDMILEVEEKLYVGVLGRLQVPDRDQWRLVLTGEATGETDVSKLDWAGRRRIAQFKSEIGLDAVTLPSAVEDPVVGDGTEFNSVVRTLAVALLQVAQSVETKYLKPPLAETDKLKQKRLKAERRLCNLAEKRGRQREEQQQDNYDDFDSEPEAEDSKLKSVSDNSLRMPLERWEASLMATVSFSQVFLHLATLDYSVTWSRSLTKTRCCVCRKGGDHEKMLLCDGCDKGHHIFCLKPKLKGIPSGDWFCDKCKPKLKAKSPKKNRSIYIEEEEDEEEEEEVEEEEEEVVEEEEEEAEDDAEAEGDSEDEADEVDVNEEGYEDDFCVICQVGGELICCDNCPRTFHLDCVDLKKLPRGTWNCQNCVPDKSKKSKGTIAEDKPTKKSADKALKETNKKRRSSPEETSVQPSKRSKRGSPDSVDDNGSKGIRPCKRQKADSSTGSEVMTNGTGKAVVRRTIIESENLHPDLLETLLFEISGHEDAWPFLKPVNKKLVPDYYLLIKKPMDFQTMREKLNSHKYRSDAEFLADGLLVFQNCQQYNMEDTTQYKAGVLLAKLFQKSARKLGLNTEAEESRLFKAARSIGTKRKRQSL